MESGVGSWTEEVQLRKKKQRGLLESKTKEQQHLQKKVLKNLRVGLLGKTKNPSASYHHSRARGPKQPKDRSFLLSLSLSLHAITRELVFISLKKPTFRWSAWFPYLGLGPVSHSLKREKEKTFSLSLELMMSFSKIKMRVFCLSFLCSVWVCMLLSSAKACLVKPIPLQL